MADTTLQGQHPALIPDHCWQVSRADEQRAVVRHSTLTPSSSFSLGSPSTHCSWPSSAPIALTYQISASPRHVAPPRAPPGRPQRQSPQRNRHVDSITHSSSTARLVCAFCHRKPCLWGPEASATGPVYERPKNKHAERYRPWPWRLRGGGSNRHTIS